MFFEHISITYKKGIPFFPVRVQYQYDVIRYPFFKWTKCPVVILFPQALLISKRNIICT